MKTNVQFQEFRNEIESNILATIKREKRDGTCGMSMRNLLQVTPTPTKSIGPSGTNVQWVYGEMFREVCESNKTIMRFLI